MSKNKPAAREARAASDGPVQYGFPLHVRLVLENACKKASKEKGRQFFIGQTADENGHGEALIEVDAKGDITRHWGTFDELMDKLP